MAQYSDRVVGDTRIFDGSDYFLPQGFVNSYEGEVKSGKARDGGISGGSNSSNTNTNSSSNYNVSSSSNAN